MKLTKFDLGAEIISILTRGMYPDPRDAVREYIQNAVDAKAKNVAIKVRSNTVTVEDDGHGMNHDVLRKAVRVGISDKNPAKSVGFMGIGIYSAFHLCDKMAIYSRGSEGIPNRLTMDFGKMKSALKWQKLQRQIENIPGDQLLDLQTLLEQHIELTENGAMKSEEMPQQGTQVVLTNLDPDFASKISSKSDMTTYLQEVIPLHFEKSENFSWGAEIETEIDRVCKERNEHFELINLTLQVAGGPISSLFRPYKNSDFNSKGVEPQKHKIEVIESNGQFFGVAWGCLNSLRQKVDNKSLRGFILKKQGFSIGNRENVMKYFPRGQTYFDRYIGEVIVLNPGMLPNAARNDFEYSELRTKFYEGLTGVADKFDEAGMDFQEWTKADAELTSVKEKLKEMNASFNADSSNSESVVVQLVKAKELEDRIGGRIKRKALRPNSEDEAKAILKESRRLQYLLQTKLTAIAEKKKLSQKERNKQFDIGKKLNEIETVAPVALKNYESLVEMLKDLDLTFDDMMSEVLGALDEKFVAGMSKNRADYYRLLNETKDYLSRTLELAA